MAQDGQDDQQMSHYGHKDGQDGPQCSHNGHSGLDELVH